MTSARRGNPIYAIRESPYRWYILAGISALAGMLGAMMMLAYTWPHALARVWLLAGIVLAVFFLIMQFRDWKRAVEAALPRAASELPPGPRTSL